MLNTLTLLKSHVSSSSKSYLVMPNWKYWLQSCLATLLLAKVNHDKNNKTAEVSVTTLVLHSLLNTVS